MRRTSITTFHEIDADFHDALSRLRHAGRCFLLMDQGGTNVRLRIYPASRRWTWPRRAWQNGDLVELKRNDIRTARDLYGLLADVAQALNLGTENAPEVRAVLAFAGAVSADRDSVPITNWIGQPVITLATLEAALQNRRVLMLNDVEAASFGLLALAELGAWPERACQLSAEGPRPISRPVGPQEALPQNRAVLVPGTGVGTGFIVYVSRVAGGKRSYWPEVVPSEVQHIPAAAHTAEEYALIEWLRQNRTEGQPPCLESIVSGQGLENVYDFLRERSTAAGMPLHTSPQITKADDRALAIARAAKSNPPDPICRASLAIYYAFCGRLAQTLALAIKAFGGVYLAGETTAHNWEFLPDSPYARNFLTNHKQLALLQQCPLYLLDKPGINLDGALYAACHRWYLKHT